MNGSATQLQLLRKTRQRRITMTSQLSQVKWVRVILTSLVVYVISFIVAFLIVTAYASVLAFQARGAPDQTAINVFASQYAPWIGNLSLLLLTFFGARHVARRVDSAIPMHGIVLGGLTGLINFALDGFALTSLVVLALTVGAGWLGARK
jgi:hypothetical protein